MSEQTGTSEPRSLEAAQEELVNQGRRPWSTKKMDRDAPRGIFRHPSSTERATIWAIRYYCAGGHLHKERVGPLKSDAIRTYYERRARAHQEPGWCPRMVHERERARLEAERERAAKRITFGMFAEQYIEWSRQHKRSWKNTRTMMRAAAAAFGARKLDEITTGDVERFRDSLFERGVTRATCNRYRDTLSGLFHRGIRLGLVERNPVKGVTKFKEVGGRVLWLSAEEEAAVSEALPSPLRPLFSISVHTGLRWGEQLALRWRDVDFLTGTITVTRSKNGYARQIPMNSLVRSSLMDLAACRQHPEDPTEQVFQDVGRADRFFPPAVQRASQTLQKAGRDASRLLGYTWHSNRHTFASRLVMAGVSLRAVQDLGGWRTSNMVNRYSHLAPEYLREAVERLVEGDGAVELSRNYPGATSRKESASRV